MKKVVTPDCRFGGIGALPIWVALLLFCSLSFAQSASSSTFIQTIVVKYNNYIYEFNREGEPNKSYGEWYCSYPPFPHANIQSAVPESKVQLGSNGGVSYSCKRYAISQNTVKEIIGIEMWNHFSKYNIATISGHFNYSNDWRFDYQKFKGQQYGTWLQQKEPDIQTPLPGRS